MDGLQLCLVDVGAVQHYILAEPSWRAADVQELEPREGRGVLRKPDEATTADVRLQGRGLGLAGPCSGTRLHPVLKVTSAKMNDIRSSM